MYTKVDIQYFFLKKKLKTIFISTFVYKMCTFVIYESMKHSYAAMPAELLGKNGE